MKVALLRRRGLSLVIGLLWACGGGDRGGAKGEGEGGSAQGDSGGNESVSPSAGASSGGTSNGAQTSTAAGGVSATDGTSGGNGAVGSSAAFGTSATNTASIPIDKLDLLLQIDNSLSMGDKQAVMAAAVPLWLSRLTNPDCVSADGETRVSMAASLPTDACPSGLTREIATPLRDIHISVVSSSLGDFGGDTCPETTTENASSGMADQNDHGWLLGALPRVTAGGVITTPFLSWTATDALDYANAIESKTTQFRNFVTAAGELGCGYEMNLESWYRFLVDPNPPQDVIREGSQMSLRSGVDTEILAQRAAFLRPDSMVAVVMLSDENDCSFKDSNAYSWWATTITASSTTNRMYRGSTACTTLGPNDPCCFSCMLGGVDTSISQACLDADASCRYGDSTALLSAADDAFNVRCWQQKRRFGFDFLFPVTRYANALSKPVLCPDQTYGDLDCDCTEANAKGVVCEAGTAVNNPLFQNATGATMTGPQRTDASQVIFAGIVGVPWQDVAKDSVTQADPLGDDASVALEYKLASELDWNLFAPVDEYATPPTDPLMVESVAPRTGTHPITEEALAASSAGFMVNSINGHEWIPDNNADLQYACIFSLNEQLADGVSTATRDCSTNSCASDDLACKRRFQGCACGESWNPETTYSPLCQQSDGSYGATQVAAKALPGLRELQALRAFYSMNGNSDNAVVASICPKDLTYANRGTSGYGYNPAFAAVFDRIRAKM